MLYDPTYTSFCDVSATVSCTQVYRAASARCAAFRSRSSARSGSRSPALLSVAGLTARPAVRESVPGYLFAVLDARARGRPVSRLRVVRPAESRCVVLCLTTYAAVIGLFLVSGAATSIPMTTLPRRAARDLRVLVASPLALIARRAVPRRRRVDARVLPARRRVAPRRPPAAAAAAAADAGSALGVRALHGDRSRACRWSSRPTAPRC